MDHTIALDPGAILAPAATQFLTQGLLGVSVLFLLWVLWYAWQEIKRERERCSSFQTELIRLGSDVARSNSEVARALEERNRVTADISTTNTKLGAAIEHLSQILDLQHDRVLEILREIKLK